MAERIGGDGPYLSNIAVNVNVNGITTTYKFETWTLDFGKIAEKYVESENNIQSENLEGDDMDDPIGDTARSILDGHIILSRKLSTKGHYPAVDVYLTGNGEEPFQKVADV